MKVPIARGRWFFSSLSLLFLLLLLLLLFFLLLLFLFLIFLISSPGRSPGRRLARGE